ncbi:hypothetical protein QK292_06020 [Arthrobacter sp. AL08]|uniref:hypothetical protein n=1 Tax=Micrococcaceae TaxID=1268 RepID=UPI001CFF8ACC|nr:MULTISPECIES: hypothetical protein [Micrococcaceae]MCB5280401.1 hypothetical protein [Arthrobacter sp. ES1]MDD1476028.1 hypothetical protein [Arthrobacter sp. H16F315]MDI3240891.1 hypothetical protein [Arthrobacter sp. AL05]MDI3277133.1 hypothetical protein [Arthrobacter sp. AL08]MDJ0352382.1 hypothetical protein [Pseudarthrobacter sp. PH31-O2]
MARYRMDNSDDTPLRRVVPDEHWNSLQQGDRVSVRLAPGYETGGRVDAITADHTAVWVHLDGGRGRTLLHCSDGVQILPPAN